MTYSFDDDTIEQFRSVVQKELDEQFTDEETRAMLNNLLELYEVLSKVSYTLTDEQRGQIGLPARSLQ